ncbi:MAG: hypothetical protein IJZ64_02670 [Ruminococcus sp.]|nr:hypothetical protein [Ruminococcus sp.]
MELKLNIYKNNKEIEKTYTANEFDLMWGTVEDFLNIIDIDKVDDKTAIQKIILSILPQIKPLLKQIFPGLTDSEIRCTKAKELIPIFVSVFKYSFSEINSIKNNSGN